MQNSSKVVPASYCSDIPRRKNLILTVTVVFISSYYLLLKFFSSIVEIEAAEKYCANDNLSSKFCSRPDILAYEVICLCNFVYFIGTAWPLWYGSGSNIHNSTPEGRLYGYWNESGKIASVFFAFQVWTFIMGFFIPEFCTLILMIHHFVTALCCWFCLQHQMYHYYCLFFSGLSEISSIPLVGITLSNYFPQTFHGVFTEVCKVSFALLFSYYRIYQWVKIAYLMSSDIGHALSNGVGEKYRPGKSYTLYATQICVYVVCLMQFYWYSIILTQIGKALGMISQ